MARFECVCGNLLSNSSVPNNIEYHVFSDYEWSDILMNDTVNVLEIPKPELNVWKCSKCERIHIFNNEGRILKTYKIENKF